MSCLHYQNEMLFIENCCLDTVATQFGTPCYVYSKQAIIHHWQHFHQTLNSLSHRICYAVKANSTLAILQLLAQQGSHFDIVSIGELKRVLAAGGKANQIIFSGVGKREDEMEVALKEGIHCFNVESVSELERLHQVAKHLNKSANISLRVNPDINPLTHAYIATGMMENKFGIEFNKIIPLCESIKSMPHLNLIGIACHIGSQITSLPPFMQSIDRMLALYEKLNNLGIVLQHLNFGGGLGIQYHDEIPPTILDYTNMIRDKLAPFRGEVIIEPGRAIIGSAGTLLTKVEYIKSTQFKQFAIVDAGMNDLLRPALYQAWQAILPVKKHHGNKSCYDIAGPLCESADFLGKDRELCIEPGDLLAVDNAGAYCFSMSSNYNSRPRPAEILIDGEKMHLIRERESIEALYALEKLITS